jgi:hypothetical protein
VRDVTRWTDYRAAALPGWRLSMNGNWGTGQRVVAIDALAEKKYR